MRKELRQLYERAGSPPKGALKRHADRSGHSVGESTLIGVPSGRGGLRWATVEAFVDACLSYAVGRPNDLQDSDHDKIRWRRAYDEAEPVDRRERSEGADRWLVREYGPGRLPRLSEVSDAVLGVTPTRHTEAGNAPYVSRELADRELRRILTNDARPYPFVVLVGQSKAGKSRTLAEAVRSHFRDADPEVLIPRDGSALVELAWTFVSGADSSPPVLVWLDDLSISDLTGLTGQVLDVWARRALICSTMTMARWDEVSFANLSVAAVARHALRRAIRVDLEFDPTAEELAQARRLYPSETVRGSLAETLVGGEQLLSRQQAGRETNPAGHAIVKAAVDVRRAGIKRAAGRAELLALFPHYLRALRSDLPIGKTPSRTA